MVLNLNYNAALRNNQLDEITSDVATSGLLRIYDGAQPTDADTALGAQTLLAELPLSATFAAAASSFAFATFDLAISHYSVGKRNLTRQINLSASSFAALFRHSARQVIYNVMCLSLCMHSHSR